MPNLISNTLALVGGAVVGAAAMYLLDPDQGEGRRGDISGSRRRRRRVHPQGRAHQRCRRPPTRPTRSPTRSASTPRDLAGQASEKVDETSDAVRASVHGASDHAHSIASRISAYAKELAGRVSGHVTDATDTLSDAADTAVGTARSAHKQAKARVADAVSAAQSYGRSTYKQAGKQVKATQDDWMERASSFPDRARSLARRALGVAEPQGHPHRQGDRHHRRQRRCLGPRCRPDVLPRSVKRTGASRPTR